MKGVPWDKKMARAKVKMGEGACALKTGASALPAHH